MALSANLPKCEDIHYKVVVFNFTDSVVCYTDRNFEPDFNYYSLLATFTNIWDIGVKTDCSQSHQSLQIKCGYIYITRSIKENTFF